MLLKTWVFPIIFAIIITTGVGSAFAASDYFLKLDGIDGESTDSSHKGEIEVMSWSWGMSQMGTTSTGGGAGTGKVQMQDFHFTKSIDKSSPMLMEMTATGEHIKNAKLTLRKAGSDSTYITVTFTDVMVSSYSVSGNSGEIPSESVSFTYQKIQMEYFPQSPTGTATDSIKTKELTGHVTLMK